MFTNCNVKISFYCCCIVLGLTVVFPAPTLLGEDGAGKETAEEKPDPSQLTLKRIFTDEDFESESFGPARWLESGEGYTTIEESEDCEDANDIVKYDPATGDSQVLISASKLIPDGMEKPLVIEDYSWSDDDTKLLIFTNTIDFSYQCSFLIIVCMSTGRTFIGPYKFA